MKTAVLTCAIYPTEDEARKALWIFIRSAEKAGVPAEDLHLYGIGRDFHRTDWRTKKLIYQLDYLKTLPSYYTHVLYSDGGDALFARSLKAIETAYQSLGYPEMICSAYHWIANWNWNHGEETPYHRHFKRNIARPFLHCGGYLAEREHVIATFQRMLELPNQTNDDCWNWMDAYAEGWFRPVIDSDCLIFYVADSVDILGKTAYIKNDWVSFPGIIHLSGGYADHGTWKDYKLEPLARELGVI